MINVLVVDDDKLVRKGLISHMPWHVFNMQVVGEAKNGEKALEFLESNEVDLLLTDLAMPVMSGIELIRIVRSKLMDVHIVVLTLHQDFEYIQEALRLGAIDYIAKVQLEQENFEDVLRRIHDRIAQEKSLRLPGNHAQSFYTEQKGNMDNKQLTNSRYDLNQEIHPELEERLNTLTGSWLTFNWIHQDELFDLQLEQLKEMKLSSSKLILFVHSVIMELNRIFGSMTSYQVNMPETFATWKETEEWLRAVRANMLKATASSFSREVIGSIMMAVRIIQEEISEQLFAIDVAKRVNMSRSYFNHCFKEIVGRSFHEYVRNVRIESAKDYLLKTNKSIQWIAERSGYMDEKYFSRVFREQTGMTPSEYRKS